MAGGNLNVASSRGGGEDIINVNPQITFFKKVYKRHTNFGIDTREVTLDSVPNFGGEFTYDIPKYGSLISSMHYEFTLTNIFDHADSTQKDQTVGVVGTTAGTSFIKLNTVNTTANYYKIPGAEDSGRRIKITEGTGAGQIRKIKTIDLTTGTDRGRAVLDKIWDTIPLKNDSKYTLESDTAYYCRYIYYINSVGYGLLDYVELYINNTLIDKHTGLWLDIWNELSDPTKKEWSLTGKRLNDPSVNFKQGRDQEQDKLRICVPLKFYFNKNPGLAFPIFLLSENSVKVKFKLNSKESIVKFDIAPDNKNPINYPQLETVLLQNFKFYTTYIFLDNGEETRIKGNLPNEYLIETLIMNNDLTTNSLAKIDNINNPIKELIWVYRNNQRLSSYIIGTNTIPKKQNDTDISDGTANEARNEPFNYAFHRINKSLGYGTRDPISSVRIKISGTERVAETDSTFFRTIQPYNHHSNVPGGFNQLEKKKYVYVYSFALNPEDYQPSGSFNFSKGDDYLTIELKSCSEDGITEQPGIPTNYRMELFFVVYKFLSVTDNNIILKDVPIVKSDYKTKDEPEQKKEAQAIEASVSKARKIEREIRYIEKPHTHGHLTKKKWGGLQEDYFKKKEI